MPSYLHELLLLLFRNRARSAADLLRHLDVQLPEYDDVRTASSDLSDLRPTEYRADLVLFLLRGKSEVLGVIVEVQLRRDDDKLYAWPAYVANLRARHRCPVCLLVITVEDAVARWAARSIELGPGSVCSPWVVGPSNTLVITDLEEAKENVELAVLSAMEHAQSPDVALATRIASAAVLACRGLDAERSTLYFDLVQLSFSRCARHEVLQGMNSLGYEYQSDFARRYVAEGKTEGRLEIVLKLLTLRFGPLTEAVQTRIRDASDARLDAVAERLLTVQTLEEALSPLRETPRQEGEEAIRCR